MHFEEWLPSCSYYDDVGGYLFILHHHQQHVLTPFQP